MDKFVLDIMLLAVEAYDEDSYISESIADLVNKQYGFNFRPWDLCRFPRTKPPKNNPLIASIYGPLIEEQLRKESIILKSFRREDK